MTNNFFNQPIHSSIELLDVPAQEPLSLDDAKLAARVDIDDDDDLIESLITAARQQCEMRLKRSLISQTWLFCLDAFPFFRDNYFLPGTITLPKPKVQTVNSVQYIDQAGVLQTWGTQYYTVDVISQPARIAPIDGQAFPQCGYYYPNAVQVNFTTGYGDDPSDVPASIIHAMKLMVAHWYRNREATTDANLKPLSMGVDALLAPGQWGFYA